MPKLYLTVALCLLISAGMATAGQAVEPIATADAITVPQLINYQGRLTDDAGNPLTGNFDFDFAIFNVASGGTAVWSETQTNVPVTDGLFNVTLGVGLNDLPDGPGCWLEITVGTTVISPRSRLVSVPYTYKSDDAEKLGGVAASGYSLSGHTHPPSPPSNFNYVQYNALGTYTSYSRNNSWAQLIPAFQVTITTTGGPVLLNLHTGGWSINTSTYSLIAGIRRGGTEIATAPSGGVLPTITTVYYPAASVNLSFIDTPPAGTHTYTVWFRLSGTTTTNRTLYQNYANNSTQMPGRNILNAIELRN